MAWSRVACSRCSKQARAERSEAQQTNAGIITASSKCPILRMKSGIKIERHTQVARSQSSKQLRGTWGCVHLATRAHKRSVRARTDEQSPCFAQKAYAPPVELQTTAEKKQCQDKNSRTDQKSPDARIRRRLKETPDQRKSARCSSNRFIRTHGVAVAVAVAVGVGVGLGVGVGVGLIVLAACMAIISLSDNALFQIVACWMLPLA